MEVVFIAWIKDHSTEKKYNVSVNMDEIKQLAYDKMRLVNPDATDIQIELEGVIEK